MRSRLAKSCNEIVPVSEGTKCEKLKIEEKIMKQKQEGSLKTEVLNKLDSPKEVKIDVAGKSLLTHMTRSRFRSETPDTVTDPKGAALAPGATKNKRTATDAFGQNDSSTTKQMKTTGGKNKPVIPDNSKLLASPSVVKKEAPGNNLTLVTYELQSKKRIAHQSTNSDSRISRPRESTVAVDIASKEKNIKASNSSKNMSSVTKCNMPIVKPSVISSKSIKASIPPVIAKKSVVGLPAKRSFRTASTASAKGAGTTKKAKLKKKNSVLFGFSTSEEESDEETEAKPVIKAEKMEEDDDGLVISSDEEEEEANNNSSGSTDNSSGSKFDDSPSSPIPSDEEEDVVDGNKIENLALLNTGKYCFAILWFFETGTIALGVSTFFCMFQMKIIKKPKSF